MRLASDHFDGIPEPFLWEYPTSHAMPRLSHKPYHCRCKHSKTPISRHLLAAASALGQVWQLFIAILLWIAINSIQLTSSRLLPALKPAFHEVFTSFEHFSRQVHQSLVHFTSQPTLQSITRSIYKQILENHTLQRPAMSGNLSNSRPSSPRGSPASRIPVPIRRSPSPPSQPSQPSTSIPQEPTPSQSDLDTFTRPVYEAPEPVIQQYHSFVDMAGEEEEAAGPAGPAAGPAVKPLSETPFNPVLPAVMPAFGGQPSNP